MRSIYLSVLFVGLICAMIGATETRAIESDASYNADPGMVVKLRREARQTGFNPIKETRDSPKINKWMLNPALRDNAVLG